MNTTKTTKRSAKKTVTQSPAAHPFSLVPVGTTSTVDGVETMRPALNVAVQRYVSNGAVILWDLVGEEWKATVLFAGNHR